MVGPLQRLVLLEKVKILTIVELVTMISTLKSAVFKLISLSRDFYFLFLLVEMFSLWQAKDLNRGWVFSNCPGWAYISSFLFEDPFMSP